MASWKRLIEKHVKTDALWCGLAEREESDWGKYFERFITHYNNEHPKRCNTHRKNKSNGSENSDKDKMDDASSPSGNDDNDVKSDTLHGQVMISPPGIGDSFFEDLYPKITEKISHIESNWSNGHCKKQQIICRSETSKGVYCLQYDSEKIVTGLRDNTIKIYDRKDLQQKACLSGHTGSVLCLQYDEQVIITGSSDSTVRVWDVKTGELLSTLVHHCEAVLHLRFANGIMVTCSKDRSIAVWDMVSPQQINMRRVIVGHRAAVNVVDFDDTYIVSASGDRTIKIWQTDNCEFVRTLSGHRRGIACLQYRKPTVVSGSSDNCIRLWNILEGKCLRILEGHEELVRCIRFDEKRIVSGAYDGRIKVWDLKKALDPTVPNDQICIQTLSQHTGRVFRLQFDEFQIISSSHDDSIIIWDFLNATEADKDNPMEVEDPMPAENSHPSQQALPNTNTAENGNSATQTENLGMATPSGQNNQPATPIASGSGGARRMNPQRSIAQIREERNGSRRNGSNRRNRQNGSAVLFANGSQNGAETRQEGNPIVPGNSVYLQQQYPQLLGFPQNGNALLAQYQMQINQMAQVNQNQRQEQEFKRNLMSFLSTLDLSDEQRAKLQPMLTESEQQPTTQSVRIPETFANGRYTSTHNFQQQMQQNAWNDLVLQQSQQQNQSQSSSTAVRPPTPQSSQENNSFRQSAVSDSNLWQSNAQVPFGYGNNSESLSQLNMLASLQQANNQASQVEIFNQLMQQQSELQARNENLDLVNRSMNAPLAQIQHAQNQSQQNSQNDNRPRSTGNNEGMNTD